MVIQKVWNTFINNNIKISIKTKSPNKTIKYIRNLNINIYSIEYQKEEINLIVKEKDLEKIEKYYNYSIVNIYGLKKISSIIKKERILIVEFVVILLLIFTYTRFIINIEILTNNKNLHRAIENALEKSTIEKYTLIKSEKNYQI